MKPFVFPLKKIRDYKDQMLEKEQAELAALQRALHRLEQKAAALRVYLGEKNEQLRQRQTEGVCLSELCAMQILIEAAERQAEETEQERRRAEAAVRAQLAVVLRLSQEISGLDKLEEKKREEHRCLLAKEYAEEILEQLTMRLSRG